MININIQNLFNVSNILGAAMQGTIARGQAINNNIANADTPGFNRQVVLFEDQLSNAINAHREGRGLDLSNFRPILTTEFDDFMFRIDENTIDIEFEMAMLYQNSVRLDVISTGILNHYRIINMVVGMMV